MFGHVHLQPTDLESASSKSINLRPLGCVCVCVSVFLVLCRSFLCVSVCSVCVSVLCVVVCFM